MLNANESLVLFCLQCTDCLELFLHFCYGTDFRNTRIGVQLAPVFSSRAVEAQDQVIKYLRSTESTTDYGLQSSCIYVEL